MQSYFQESKAVRKFIFGCQTLTHGTEMRRLPQQLVCYYLDWLLPRGVVLQVLTLSATAWHNLYDFVVQSLDHRMDPSFSHDF